MPVTIGKTYYLITHAYHHFLAEVVEVTGKREADCTRVVRVHSCRRDWTLFFRDGCGGDTVFYHFPDGSLTWLAAFEWPHPIPEAPDAPRRRARP